MIDRYKIRMPSAFTFLETDPNGGVVKHEDHVGECNLAHARGYEKGEENGWQRCRAEAHGPEGVWVRYQEVCRRLYNMTAEEAVRESGWNDIAEDLRAENDKLRDFIAEGVRAPAHRGEDAAVRVKLKMAEADRATLKGIISDLNGVISKKNDSMTALDKEIAQAYAAARASDEAEREAVDERDEWRGRVEEWRKAFGEFADDEMVTPEGMAAWCELKKRQVANRNNQLLEKIRDIRLAEELMRKCDKERLEWMNCANSRRASSAALREEMCDWRLRARKWEEALEQVTGGEEITPSAMASDIKWLRDNAIVLGEQIAAKDKEIARLNDHQEEDFLMSPRGKELRATLAKLRLRIETWEEALRNAGYVSALTPEKMSELIQDLRDGIMSAGQNTSDLAAEVVVLTDARDKARAATRQAEEVGKTIRRDLVDIQRGGRQDDTEGSCGHTETTSTTCEGDLDPHRGI